MRKGMVVEVFRSNHDCTNGPTSTADSVLLVGPGIPEVLEATSGQVVMELSSRVDGASCAIPEGTGGRRLQFGGNFIWSSDSRFRALSEQPIPVHDRDERASFGDSFSIVDGIGTGGLPQVFAVQCPASLRALGLIYFSSKQSFTIRGLRQINEREFNFMANHLIPTVEITEEDMTSWWLNQLVEGAEVFCFAASDGLKGLTRVKKILAEGEKIRSYDDKIVVVKLNGSPLEVEVRQLLPFNIDVLSACRFIERANFRAQDGSE